MKKYILIFVTLLTLASCTFHKTPYVRYTVEVHFTGGHIDTLVLPDAKTQTVGMKNGCLYTGKGGIAVACNVMYFKVLKREINYY